MCVKDNQHLFHNRTPDSGELIIMVIFYLFIGVLAVFGDLWVNHTNYGFPQLKWIVIAFSTGVLISVVNVFIAYFTKSGQQLTSILKDILGESPIFWLLLLVIIGSISEEMVFRALSLNWLAYKITPWPAIMLTSIIFGALHGFFRFPFILWSFTALLWGIVLGWLMIASGFILVPVIIHVTINLLGIAWLRMSN